jgi:hypothetical protein
MRAGCALLCADTAAPTGALDAQKDSAGEDGGVSEQLRERLEHYAKDDGYMTADECFYESATSLLQLGLLGFCACGRPEENLGYVLDGMEVLFESRPSMSEGREAWDAWYRPWRDRVSAHFKTSEAEYFFAYWLDHEGYADHGGSVPGWLTGEGEKLLGLLREWDALTSREEDDE